MTSEIALEREKLESIHVLLARSLKEHRLKERHDFQERVSLRAEISQCNWMIFIATWAVLLGMVWATTQPDYDFLVVPLGIAWSHAMARYDFLIQRVGAFLRATGSSWEESTQRKRSLWILAASDAGCMLPIVYLFGRAIFTLWMNDERLIAVASAVYFAFGIGLLIMAAMTHKKPAGRSIPAFQDPDSDSGPSPGAPDPAYPAELRKVVRP